MKDVKTRAETLRRTIGHRIVDGKDAAVMTVSQSYPTDATTSGMPAPTPSESRAGSCRSAGNCVSVVDTSSKAMPAVRSSHATLRSPSPRPGSSAVARVGSRSRSSPNRAGTRASNSRTSLTPKATTGKRTVREPSASVGIRHFSVSACTSIRVLRSIQPSSRNGPSRPRGSPTSGKRETAGATPMWLREPTRMRHAHEPIAPLLSTPAPERHYSRVLLKASMNPNGARSPRQRSKISCASA